MCPVSLCTCLLALRSSLDMVICSALLLYISRRLRISLSFLFLPFSSSFIPASSVMSFAVNCIYGFSLQVISSCINCQVFDPSEYTVLWSKPVISVMFFPDRFCDIAFMERLANTTLPLFSANATPAGSRSIASFTEVRVRLSLRRRFLCCVPQKRYMTVISSKASTNTAGSEQNAVVALGQVLM